jgi:hypothetical protein
VNEAGRRYDIPRNVRGYDADDVKIIEAISGFRAGGYDEPLGFTVFDTLRYRDALGPLVAEVRTLLDRRDALEAAPGRAPAPARRAVKRPFRSRQAVDLRHERR